LYTLQGINPTFYQKKTYHSKPTHTPFFGAQGTRRAARKSYPASGLGGCVVVDKGSAGNVWNLRSSEILLPVVIASL